MAWRYIVIGNFKTVDRSFAATSLVNQFEDVSDEPSGIDNASFKIIVDEFIDRRNAAGWGIMEVVHSAEDVLVIDGMTSADYEQLKLEGAGLWSTAAINQRHFDLFLFFERGGTVAEFEEQGGDLEELKGGFTTPDAA